MQTPDFLLVDKVRVIFFRWTCLNKNVVPAKKKFFDQRPRQLDLTNDKWIKGKNI